MGCDALICATSLYGGSRSRTRYNGRLYNLFSVVERPGPIVCASAVPPRGRFFAVGGFSSRKNRAPKTRIHRRPSPAQSKKVGIGRWICTNSGDPCGLFCSPSTGVISRIESGAADLDLEVDAYPGGRNVWMSGDRTAALRRCLRLRRGGGKAMRRQNPRPSDRPWAQPQRPRVASARPHRFEP
jgi:hypothetical protein